MKTTNNNLKIKVHCDFYYSGLSEISYNNCIIYFADSKYYEKSDTSLIIDSVMKLSKIKDARLNSITIDLVESDKQYNDEIIDSFRVINRSGELLYDRINSFSKTYNFDDKKTIDSIKTFLSKYLNLLNNSAFCIYIDSNINKN